MEVKQLTTQRSQFLFSAQKVLFFWHQYRRKITDLCRVFQLRIKWLTQILVNHFEKWGLSHSEKPIVLSLLTVITDPEGMARTVLVACGVKMDGIIWRKWKNKTKAWHEIYHLKMINTNLIIFLCIVKGMNYHNHRTNHSHVPDLFNMLFLYVITWFREFGKWNFNLLRVFLSSL